MEKARFSNSNRFPSCANGKGNSIEIVHQLLHLGVDYSYESCFLLIKHPFISSLPKGYFRFSFPKNIEVSRAKGPSVLLHL